MNLSEKIFIAGGNGMVGKLALKVQLLRKNFDINP